MEHFVAVFKLDLTEETRRQLQEEACCLLLRHTGSAYAVNYNFTFYTFLQPVRTAQMWFVTTDNSSLINVHVYDCDSLLDFSICR